MIRVFSATDKNFSSNGDVVLKPLRASVFKADNGDFYLDLETSLEHVDKLVEGNIVVAHTPQGDQAFRIGNVQKTGSRLITKCWHVFYDAENYLIADSYVVDKNCNDALNHLNSATEPQSEFTVFSDVQTIDSYRCVRKSLYEAINEVIGRWGGHLVRNNFYVAVLSEIGTDNGITVQYKKNLKEITCEENWDEVVTKILPVGQDGVLLNAVDPSANIYISAQTQYDLPYTKTVTFDQEFDRESYETEEAYLTAIVEDLRAQAEDYLEKNCVPKVNYTLTANLDKTTDIGDTIEVIDERLGVHLMTHVISYEYDTILEQYTQIEFGNFTQSLSDLIGTVNANAETVAKESAKNATDQVIGILSDSYVIYDGTRILVVDSLPKESASDVIIIDHTGIGFSQSGINGAQTSKWGIDGQLMLNEDYVTDFVKATGTTDGWKWQKYASGVIECFKQVSISSSDITWSTILSSFKQGNIDVAYPFDIADAVIEACLNDSGDIGWVASAKAVNATKSNVTIIRQGNTGTMTINILVKGSEPSV